MIKVFISILMFVVIICLSLVFVMYCVIASLICFIGSQVMGIIYDLH